jgi:DNA helicase II / ATP-dependent DNA helicase PcrA
MVAGMARQYKLQREPATGRSGIDYRAELNDEQFAAVTSKPGPALVIAGAGSGKTRTLTYRVAWLLDQGVPPAALLLLTFTNKAAREMLERVKALLPFDLSDLWGGTFHSIGNRMLRKHCELLGWRRNFSIMDREDQKDLMAAVIAGAGIDPKEYRFPKPDVFCDILSYALNTASPLERVVEARYPYFAHLAELFDKVAAAYAAKKREVNSMDFDDLLVQAVGLLRRHPEVRENYSRRFGFVLVDEFQDTNSIQAEFVDLVAPENRSLMVVGDDAQSIYSWRGANFENILAFPERYPGTRVFRIETNYRSTPEILGLANASIRINARQFEKTLRAARPSGPKPALIPLADPKQQAAFVAQRILELRDEGVELREMAVLYRAHFHSMDIQMELTARGIPFQITSGLRFFEQAHVKDVAAFLRFVVNPRDEVAFTRIVRMLPGVGGKTAEGLWAKWLRVERACGGRPEAYSPHLGAIKVPAKAAEAWRQLGFTLDELVPGGAPAHPAAAIHSVMHGVYEDLMRAKFSNFEQRWQDLEQLRLFASGHADLETLLGELALLSGVDVAADGKQEPDGESVTLSSVHQAKGLEWQAVFLVWLADGMFPNARAVDAGDPAALEEERRLFYVALTRAKDDLHLCYPMLWPGNYQGEVIQRPSPFLCELPADAMEAWEVG